MQTLYSQCLVLYLEQADVSVNQAKLAEIGFMENGHFIILESISDRIASTWRVGCLRMSGECRDG